MTDLYKLIRLALETFGFMLTDFRYLLLIGVVFVLVYRQYAKVHTYELRMFRLNRFKPLTETFTALIYGIGGGFLATFLFITLGVSISDAGITYLWLVALFLMLFNPRFLCFSYASGLLSLFALLTGYPELHIPSLMALVAILHLVEATLIFLHGYRLPTPMYVKHANGKIVGAFTLQKFWPMPTIALLSVAVLNSAVSMQSISMPDWWPIFQSNMALGPDHTLVHMLFPLIVALGYGDLVQTELPKTKARKSATVLFLYSLVLLLLALLANKMSIFMILPVLFGPLGHELVIWWGKKREENREPIFHSEDGIMIMTVYPNSPAEKMGLGVGDVIKSINGVEVRDIRTLVEQVSPWVIDPVLIVENQFRTPSQREIRFNGKIPPLGIIPTPHAQQGFYARPRDSFFERLWKKWQARRK